MHRVLALRARVRRAAGHVRADGRRSRLPVEDRPRARTIRSSIRNAFRAAPACRPVRPARWSRNRCCRKGTPDHSAITTCAYCGVGCSFRAEMKGDEVVRMVPNKDGHANHGHSCVKGRFARGYATHPDRILKPMIRAKITDPWREVSWDEAIGHAASRVQAHPGQVRSRFDRRHHLVALHERGNVPRAEAGARRVRQQQCRYLRTRMPFADRLRPQEHARRIGRHAEFRFGDEGRRDHGHRRESDRRPSGVRLADEAALAPEGARS